jgi:hypothetical protein
MSVKAYAYITFTYVKMWWAYTFNDEVVSLYKEIPCKDRLF